jgi:hypothetical protein
VNLKFGQKKLVNADAHSINHARRIDSGMIGIANVTVIKNLELVVLNLIKFGVIR